MIRSLWLYCTNSIKVLFPDIPACFWETAGDGNWWLKLPSKPDGVEITDEYLLGESDNPYLVTFRRLRRASNYQRVTKGYKITIQQKAAFFYCLQAIAMADDGRLATVTILDFIRPERTDFLTARSQVTPTSPYTQRAGILPKVEPNGPLVGTTGAELWFSGGFSVTFREELVR